MNRLPAGSRDVAVISWRENNVADERVPKIDRCYPDADGLYPLGAYQRRRNETASPISMLLPDGGEMARYQVRGPHGSGRDYARWTVVDTADRDIAVHTTRTKADALAAARELNAGDR